MVFFLFVFFCLFFANRGLDKTPRRSSIGVGLVWFGCLLDFTLIPPHCDTCNSTYTIHQRG